LRKGCRKDDNPLRWLGQTWDVAADRLVAEISSASGLSNFLDIDKARVTVQHIASEVRFCQQIFSRAVPADSKQWLETARAWLKSGLPPANLWQQRLAKVLEFIAACRLGDAPPV
jgi:hypothetical protein